LQTAASAAVKVESNNAELIAVTVLDDDKKTLHQQLGFWHDELNQLILRQRQLAQHW
jgi:phosphoribosylcarboxyaminoimidazole (NCAIR) mutase